MNHHPAGLSHLLHSVRTAEVAGAKDRSRGTLAVAAENLSAEGAFDTLPTAKDQDPACKECGTILVYVKDRWKCLNCGATEPDHGDFVTRADRVPATELPVLRDPDGAAIDAALRADDADDYEPEVEEEVDLRREWDRILKYGMSFFIPFGIMLALCGLLTPATPTPIDDSLPSSGCMERSRATNPATATDGWRGFLWTT